MFDNIVRLYGLYGRPFITYARIFQKVVDEPLHLGAEFHQCLQRVSRLLVQVIPVLTQQNPAEPFDANERFLQIVGDNIREIAQLAVAAFDLLRLFHRLLVQPRIFQGRADQTSYNREHLTFRGRDLTGSSKQYVNGSKNLILCLQRNHGNCLPSFLCCHLPTLGSDSHVLLQTITDVLGPTTPHGFAGETVVHLQARNEWQDV